MSNRAALALFTTLLTAHKKAVQRYEMERADIAMEKKRQASLYPTCVLIPHAEYEARERALFMACADAVNRDEARVVTLAGDINSAFLAAQTHRITLGRACECEVCTALDDLRESEKELRKCWYESGPQYCGCADCDPIQPPMLEEPPPAPTLADVHGEDGADY